MSCEGCNLKFADYYSENIYTWCTNCGNYGIHAAVKKALVELEIEPKNVFMSFDVGCNGNGSDKIEGYRFHGLHGRAIPLACGAAVANENVKVLGFGGDGGTMGEGINHLINAVRANFNMTFILHNNQNYGLTTGQASSTTKKGIPMNSSPDGITSEPLNPAKFVLGLNPSFVARTFSGDIKHMVKTIKAGVEHKGFSFIEIFQSCPTYNKATPHEWYQQRIFDVSEMKDYDGSDIKKALEISEDIDEKIAIGVLYKDEAKQDFMAKQVNRAELKTELVEEVRNYDVENLLQSFR